MKTTTICLCCGLLAVLALRVALAGAQEAREETIAPSSDSLPQTSVIARVDAGVLADFRPPEDIRSEVLRDGEKPGIRLTHFGEEPLSVTIAELALANGTPERVAYVADMACEDIEGSVYLEMYAVVDGQAYFSRALHDRFTGDQTSRQSTTPFHFTSGGRPELVRLGVRFEGPGTVVLQDMALLDATSAWQGGRWAGVAGGVCGILGGLWGAIAGMLASRGRARRLVLAGTTMIAAASGLLLLSGATLYLRGATWHIWFPAVNMGLVGLLVFGIGFFVIRQRYEEAERRRMLAMDLH
jgi:hypothetical protein